MEKFDSVDYYINSFSGTKKEILLEFRKLIKRLAPTSIESISYGMPGYKINGKPLVYFAGFKKHIGFFPTAKDLGYLEKDVKKYRTGKGTLQFKDGEKIPWELVKKIVDKRIEDLS